MTFITDAEVIKDSNKVTFLPGSGCNDQDKWLRFKVTMYAGGQSTSIDVEWKRSGGQSNWGTKFSSNSGQYLALNTATCSGHNCLNRTYRDGNGNQFYNNLTVGIAPGGASEVKLNSLQLGTVVITDGYGDIIAKDPFRG
ncbi:hypothetical protein L3V83_02155 [Thiotrichales bacterium 19X7-9]|nr:hypothetical protein [Thiotrichales bacterium 19X7-9]